MVAVTSSEGTAYSLTESKFKLAGKTGTAQVFSCVVEIMMRIKFKKD